MTQLRSIDSFHYPIGSLDWISPCVSNEVDEKLEECSDCDADMDFTLSQLEEATEVVDWHERLDKVLRLMGDDKHTN